MKSALLVVCALLTRDEIELNDAEERARVMKTQRRRRSVCARQIQRRYCTQAKRQKAKTHDAAPCKQTRSDRVRAHTHTNGKMCWSVKILRARGIGKSFFFVQRRLWNIQLLALLALLALSAIGNAKCDLPRPLCVYSPRADAVMITILSNWNISNRSVRCTCAHAFPFYTEMRLQSSLLLPPPPSLLLLRAWVELRAWASAYRIAALNSVTLRSLSSFVWWMPLNSWQHAAVKQLLSKYDTIN